MLSWIIEQDASRQLAGVKVAGQPAMREAYSYDPAGNRLTAQKGNTVSTTGYNALNQITTTTGGGKLRISGTTDEPANVTVQGQSATMLTSTNFTSLASVNVGTNNIPVTATDGNNNTSTNIYQIVVPSVAAKTFVYDPNGNLRSDGQRTYEWDAKSRLIRAKSGNDTYEWTYNGLDQRVTEKLNGVLTKRWVWAGGPQPAQERDANNAVLRRFYPQGEQIGAEKFYYTKDHLGSIREVLDETGTIVSAYSYSPWGQRTTLTEESITDIGYTGHQLHSDLGLVLTKYRGYDPETSRWLSRDPIGEAGGDNLYGYVSNNPINVTDPLGLQSALSPGALGTLPEIAAIEAGYPSAAAMAKALAAAALAASLPDEAKGLYDHMQEHIGKVNGVCPSGSPDPNDPNQDPVKKWIKEVKAAVKNLESVLKKLPKNKSKREPVEKAIKEGNDALKQWQQ